MSAWTRGMALMTSFIPCPLFPCTFHFVSYDFPHIGSSSSPAIHRRYRQANMRFLVVRAILVSSRTHYQNSSWRKLSFLKNAIALSNMREGNKEQNFTTSAKCQVTTSTFSTKHQQFCLFRHPSASAYVHQSEWFFLSANAFYIMLRNFWCSSRKKM